MEISFYAGYIFFYIVLYHIKRDRHLLHYRGIVP